MRKALPIAGILTLLLFLPAMTQNTVDPSHIKQLVSQHAAKLGIGFSDLQNYRVVSAYYDETTGLTMAYLQQTWKGVDVFNAIMSVAFKNENVGAFQSAWIADADSKTKNVAFKPKIAAGTALRNALANISQPGMRPSWVALSRTADGQEFEYDNMGVALDNIRVRLMWVPDHGNQDLLVLSWQVSLTTLKGNDSWLIDVDASGGRIVQKTNLTTKCTWVARQQHNVYAYEVETFDDNVTDAPTDLESVAAVDSAKYLVIPYPYMDPDHKAPTLVANPWKINGNGLAYTKKWNSDATMDYKDSLKGNNVFAYEDENHDNKPGYSPASQTPLPVLTWNYTRDLNIDPREDPALGIVNLFYWNNLMHDMSYEYGFNEAAGNMQTSNFGRGGKGSDLVLSEAMDGGDTSNANFAPAVDGKKSRMQMFLWRPSPLKLLKFNSPTSFVGPKPAAESAVSTNNKLASKGIITQNVVLYRDALHPDSSTACGAPSNAAQITGKIAYIDRGSCAFTVKFQNAQSAGAKAIIVGNVAEDDPRYTDGSTGNVLVTMSASPLVNSINIPGVFIFYDTAQRLKSFLLNNITTNATLSPTPMIDGDLDNGIPAHEYTHGISNRLTGGPTT
ncbi:MAG TPA: M36 family metallopeptidase, partial [Parafilimonas sp.]|nr:M36 family metallopeptidase [Parafilimonas sp.]